MSRVVVIGAGAMGLAAAYHALKRGYDVILLEAAPGPDDLASHFDLGGLWIERFIILFASRIKRPSTCSPNLNSA